MRIVRRAGLDVWIAIDRVSGDLRVFRSEANAKEWANPCYEVIHKPIEFIETHPPPGSEPVLWKPAESP